MYSDYTKCYFPSRRVSIVDTTLRDGNQSAFGTMYDWEKLAIALQLEKMGVDVIEAGFAVSNGNREVMARITENVKETCLSGLARGKYEDIDATYEALKNHENRMIHIFIPTSEVQIRAKFDKTQEEITAMAIDSIRYARARFEKVEFTAEDAYRSNRDFLRRIYTEAIRAGATTINIADTVGCADPQFFGPLVKEVGDYCKNENSDVKISVHCHNDLGLAWANSLAGLWNGADIVEATIYGIGERAGNCALEQVVARTLVEPRFYHTGVNTRQLYPAAKMVSEATGIKNETAPIVGETAFAHKSGIHQHAVVNNAESYEALNPADFGRVSEIIIGPHSGYHGMIEKAFQLGFNISEACAKIVLEIVQDKVKKQVQKRFSDADVIEIIKQAA